MTFVHFFSGNNTIVTIIGGFSLLLLLTLNVRYDKIGFVKIVNLLFFAGSNVRRRKYGHDDYVLMVLGLFGFV